MIELAGRAFGKDDTGAYSGPLQQTLAAWKAEGDDVLAVSVRLPTRGVWYVWLKVACPGPWPAVLTWDLDGVQRLESARKEVLVQPSPAPAWVTFTRHPGFRVEVHADRPGDHVIRFRRVAGNVTIEKIILTLYFSAKLAGDTLDLTGDPGHGRIEFPHGDLAVDGFRDEAPSPPIRATGTTYYVDAAAGDDAADGTEPGRAWKSAAPVNGRTFRPGDAILLKRGGRYDGGLAPRGSGTAEAWITLGAWGDGPRPVVRGRGRPGLGLRDQSHWAVQDLAVVGDADSGESAIDLCVTKGAPRARGARIVNCLAYDAGGHGIHVGGEPGYDGVVIENCLACCNAGDGIVVHGSTARGSGRNTVIRRCTTYSNPGMAGIWIHSAENGLIERCLAYNNACVNIWSWNAVNITMRECETFRGRPQRDAAGFDIDWGSQACVLERCYAHHNEGDGFLLMGSGDLDYLGGTMQSNHNLMRWCVAEGHAPIDLGETFNHSLVYGNISVALGPQAHACKVFGWPNDEKGGQGGWPVDTRVMHNVFLALDGATGLYADDHATDQGNAWDHNRYWAPSTTGPLIRWGGRENGPGFWKGDRKTGTYPPADFADLAAFRRATGQEAHGTQEDPRFPAAGAGAYGRLPLAAYRRPAGSPPASVPGLLTPAWLAARRKHLTDTGAEAYGIPMDPAPDSVDYWGEPLGGPPR